MNEDNLNEVICDKNPLITFALFAYNQEDLILQAIEGALSQDYSPLEIIISDDCSVDMTFDVIKQEVERYKGPHKLILNRNKKNLGIGGHINKVMKLASGDLIVVAAGDDISLPCRVKIIAREWQRLGSGLISLHSSVIKMDESGGDLGLYRSKYYDCTSPRDQIDFHVLIGASHAWSKKLFNYFGDLNPNIVNEDRVIGLRASLMGGVHFIDMPLVKYRVGGISMKKPEPLNINELLFIEPKDRTIRAYYDAEQALADLEKTSHEDYVVLSKKLIGMRDQLYVQMRLIMRENPLFVLIKNPTKISLVNIKSVVRYSFPSIYWQIYKYRQRKAIIGVVDQGAKV